MRALIAAVAALWVGGVAIGQVTPDPALYPNCAGYISVQCCCTANACFVIARSEIERLDEDTYRIIRTGEVVKAKGRSPDGKVRRCTGNHEDGMWSRLGDPSARTTCLYVTDTGS